MCFEEASQYLTHLSVLRFTCERGRIAVSLTLEHVGTDVLARLSGGRAHLGAVAFLSGDDELLHVLRAHGHREGELAALVTQELADLFQSRVCTVAGIHFDDISREEIADVVTCVHNLLARVRSALGREGPRSTAHTL